MLHARVHWRAAHRCLVPPGISGARRHAKHSQQRLTRGVAAARIRAVHTSASASTNKQELGWQELHRAAQIAAWSGLCYLMPGELPAAIEQQHKGNLTLLASGRNEYTAWFVADAVVPAATFCSTVQNRSSRSSSSSSSSSGNTSSSDGSDGDPAAAAAGGVCAQVPAGTRERFVFFRGVSWAAPEYSGAKMSQALGAMWPTQFPPGSSSSGSSSSSSSSGGSTPEQAASPLVAHAGVAGIAQDLFVQLRPYMQQADDVGMPLCLAGHSLGGSLAMLTLVLHRMYNRKRRPTPIPSCYTFGSPPVLAHQAGGGGQRVLEVLGLTPSSVHNHVLEMDPVPRALLSVDPTFELLSSWGAVKGLLWLREQLVGAGSPLSPGRFLFESVGQVHLIKYTPEAGSQVVPLDATEIQQELSMLSPKLGPGSAAAPAAAPQPDQSHRDAEAGGGGAAGMLYTSLRAWLDHHHRSYAQELEAAALRSVRQQMAVQQRQQLQAQQQQAQQQQMVPAHGDASA